MKDETGRTVIHVWTYPARPINRKWLMKAYHLKGEVQFETEEWDGFPEPPGAYSAHGEADVQRVPGGSTGPIQHKNGAPAPLR